MPPAGQPVRGDRLVIGRPGRFGLGAAQASIEEVGGKIGTQDPEARRGAHQLGYQRTPKAPRGRHSQCRKNAAIATPICSFAAAARRSADAISGRRSRMADGISTGTAGGVALSGDRGIENIDAGWPTSTAIACSNCARATPLSMAAACADCNYVCA